MNEATARISFKHKGITYRAGQSVNSTEVEEFDYLVEKKLFVPSTSDDAKKAETDAKEIEIQKEAKAIAEKKRLTGEAKKAGEAKKTEEGKTKVPGEAKKLTESKAKVAETAKAKAAETAKANNKDKV